MGQGRFRQQVVEQFCMLAGGPCVYTGRTEWPLAVTYLTASLDRYVARRERDELIAVVARFKPDIVEK